MFGFSPNLLMRKWKRKREVKMKGEGEMKVVKKMNQREVVRKEDEDIEEERETGDESIDDENSEGNEDEEVEGDETEEEPDVEDDTGERNWWDVFMGWLSSGRPETEEDEEETDQEDDEVSVDGFEMGD